MKKVCKIFAQFKKKVVSLQYKLKNNTDMTKEFTTHLNERYKVSFNFRTNVIRIWIFYHNSWIKHLKSGTLTKQEILEVAYDMTGNDFKQFLKTDNFSIWRF